jgi:hypothetical protein
MGMATKQVLGLFAIKYAILLGDYSLKTMELMI